MHISETDRLKIVEWAKNHAVIKRVYLYGSRARGDHRPDSDIDLGIEVTTEDKTEAMLDWWDWHNKYEEAPDLHLEHSVQLEWYHPDADLELVGTGVERDGILLFDRI